MITSSMIQDAARDLRNTPFHHQGRAPRVGLDCVGVVVVVARTVGITVHDVRAYPRKPDGRLVPLISSQLEPLSAATAAYPGDVLVFTSGRHPYHVGIRTDYGVLHADASSSHVTEVSLDSYWQRRLHSAWRFPGVVVDLPEPVGFDLYPPPKQRHRAPRCRGCLGKDS